MHAQWKNEPLLTKNRGRISSVGRALDCRAGGRGFDSQGRTNTQGLKITEKWRYSLCPESGWTFAWLGWPRKMAVPSPLGGVKYSVPKWHFRAKYIDTYSAFFCYVSIICITRNTFIAKKPREAVMALWFPAFPSGHLESSESMWPF